MQEVRADLFTQSAYAKLIRMTRQRVNQMVKAGELKTVAINGSILIKKDN